MNKQNLYNLLEKIDVIKTKQLESRSAGYIMYQILAERFRMSKSQVN